MSAQKLKSTVHKIAVEVTGIETGLYAIVNPYFGDFDLDFLSRQENALKTTLVRRWCDLHGNVFELVVLIEVGVLWRWSLALRRLYANLKVLKHCLILKLRTDTGSRIDAGLRIQAWIWLCHTDPISLCVDSSVFTFVYFMCVFYISWYYIFVVLLYNTVRWTSCDWNLILRTLFFFSALTLLGWSFDP